MAIIRYTSPTQEILLKGIDLTSADRVCVTYRNGTFCRTLEDVTVEAVDDDTMITVELDQELTSRFDARRELYIQVNWMEDGKRLATRIKRADVCQNLLEEVLS